MAFFLTRRPAGQKKLGIYVHIPFCKSKCEYCDFYSLGGSRDRRVTDDYLQALADHIKESGRLTPEHVVDTVYFGGGTHRPTRRSNARSSTRFSAASASTPIRRLRWRPIRTA